MSLYGWVILVISVGGTTGFLVWCLARVLKNHSQKGRLHGTSDLEPRSFEGSDNKDFFS